MNFPGRPPSAPRAHRRDVLFVTGLCGRLGRAVAAEASAQGWKVSGLDVAPWPEDQPRPANVELHSGPLDDLSLLGRLLEGSTHLIHTAGLHGGHVADHCLADFVHSNVKQVGRLVELCEEKKIRSVCLSSTMEVLVGRDYAASGATVLDEASPLQTDSAYSVSRAVMERLAAEIARRRPLSLSVLRYMAFGYKKDASLGPSLLARALTAADAARAALRAVCTGGLKGEIFNIGPKTPLTNADIARALQDPAAVVEKHFPGAGEILEKTGQRLSSEMCWPVTSIEKARRLLGWEPSYTFASWLADHGWTPRS